MPDAHASAFEHEKPAAGTGSPAGSPYHVGIRETQKIPETELSNIPFPGPLHPTFDPNGVGACRRPALPGRRFLYVPRNPPERVPSIVVGRKSSSAAFSPAFYGLYTAFTPVIMSLFSFFSGSLVRLSFMSRVCSLPPFWKVPVHRASLSWYRVASTTSL